MKRFAAIDVGTNSVKLLIGGVSGGKLTFLLDRVRITRLGEGLRAGGVVSREAADRTVAALAGFRRIAERRGVERLAAVGTMALRAAKNGKAFVRRCARDAGLDVRVLSGEEEAALAFQGATWGVRAAKVLAIDIGGGSTEVMVGTRAKLRAAWSLPLGAVTLTEEFLRGDPPAAGDLQRLSAAIRRRLPRAIARIGKGGGLLGIGGTVHAVMNLLRKEMRREDDSVPFESVSALAKLLSIRTTAERRRMGLERGRADIVVAGAWLLTAAMSHLGATALRACARGLRHGLLIELASGRRA